MKLPEFRFADCVLDPARRELWRADVRQAIEPKPFDLLHYLLQHRSRVVSHDELLAVLWPDQPVKPGALARAVMLARRALGESQAGELIQTASRVGYRFVGEVIAGEAGERPLPLALLPFDNQTGDHQLDWIELGLMSVVARSLASEPRLDVASPARVLSALETLPPEAPAREKAGALQRLLGVNRVVTVSVGGRPSAFSLRARWIGADEEGWSAGGGLVAAGDGTLSHLAAGLARQLAEALLPHPPAALPGDDQGDPLAEEAMARALQAAAQERWTTACNLMRVVLDAAPGNEAVQLELLRCQAALGDPAAQAGGAALLRDAALRDDRRLQAQVEQALGRNALNRGAFAEARERLARALELAGNEETAGWTVQTLLWQSSAALQQGDFAAAEPPLEQASRLCESSGNRIDALACLTHRALILDHQGELPQSMALSREVMHRSRELRLHRYFVDAANNLATDCACVGRLHEATETAEEGLETAASLPDRYHVGVLGTTLAPAYFHLRRADAADRLVARLEGLGFGSAVSGDEADLLWVRGFHAAIHGHPGRGAELLEAAQRWFAERGNHLVDEELLPWSLAFAARAGQFDRAARWFAEHGAASKHSVLEGGLTYARAALAHAQGLVEPAHRMLCRLVDEEVPTWSALAALDAAWLATEAGDLARARAYLDGLGRWHGEHPVAQAVEARWHFARADLAAARMYQRRFEAVVQAPAAQPLVELGRRYEAAGGERLAMPAAPWLATLW